jgi:hypothetical protein
MPRDAPVTMVVAPPHCTPATVAQT